MKIKLCNIYKYKKAFMISTWISKYQNNKIKSTESKMKRYLHTISYITRILIGILKYS